MGAKILQLQFAISYRALVANLDEIDHEDSLRQPQPGGNCLNWVVGHLVGTREAALSLLGESAVRTEAEVERFRRGSDPVLGADDAMDFDKMRADLATSQERLIRGLGKLTAEDLNKVEGEQTVAERLALLSFHESYHVGQAGVLRRMTGRERAIA